jgi:hypothetical protein
MSEWGGISVFTAEFVTSNVGVSLLLGAAATGASEIGMMRSERKHQMDAVANRDEIA